MQSLTVWCSESTSEMEPRRQLLALDGRTDPTSSLFRRPTVAWYRSSAAASALACVSANSSLTRRSSRSASRACRGTVYQRRPAPGHPQYRVPTVGPPQARCCLDQDHVVSQTILAKSTTEVCQAIMAISPARGTARAAGRAHRRLTCNQMTAAALMILASLRRQRRNVPSRTMAQSQCIDLDSASLQALRRPHPGLAAGQFLHQPRPSLPVEAQEPYQHVSVDSQVGVGTPHALPTATWGCVFVWVRAGGCRDAACDAGRARGGGGGGGCRTAASWPTSHRSMLQCTEVNYQP